MTETMTDAVHDLVNPWVDVIRTDDRKTPYKPVDHEPLLVMLRKAVRASTGRTAAGRTDSAERSLLNVKAFDLWNQIGREVAQATRRHTRDRANPLLGYALRTLAEKIDALWNVNQISEDDYLHLIRRARAWRYQILAIFDPPVEKELGECPECEQGKVLDDDGLMQTALVAYYRHGYEPVARCKHCGYTWQGEAQLVILGKRIGANMDVDTLTEMGVHVE